MRSKKSERNKEQSKNRNRNCLNTMRLSRAELVQGAGTLFLPLLLAHPHVFFVGNLEGWC